MRYHSSPDFLCRAARFVRREVHVFDRTDTPLYRELLRTILRAGCTVKNIRESTLPDLKERPENEAFGRHSVHDVQLPIPGLRPVHKSRIPTSSLRRIGRMYYILKAGRTIKRFAGARDGQTGSPGFF